jgi:hypothetical protein
MTAGLRSAEAEPADQGPVSGGMTGPIPRRDAASGDIRQSAALSRGPTHHTAVVFRGGKGYERRRCEWCGVAAGSLDTGGKRFALCGQGCRLRSQCIQGHDMGSQS